MKPINILNKINESATEEYWGAKELDRRLFTALLKFNKPDSRGNNYIITNDNNELVRFNAPSDKEAIEIFKTKKYVEPGFGELKESEDGFTTYTVTVGFGGFVGVEEDYNITARSRKEAVYYAVDEDGAEAELDLSVENIEDLGDGEYEVEVGFAGNAGATNTYKVNADSEEEAEQYAIEEAKQDLAVVAVDGEEFSYEEED